jgi:predicted ATPase
LANGRYLITGCSGGGKSSLIDALSVYGYTVVPEAGRLIVQEQLAIGGKILPWLDMTSFVRRLSQGSIEQFDHVNDLDRPPFLTVDLSRHLRIGGHLTPKLFWYSKMKSACEDIAIRFFNTALARIVCRRCRASP